MLQDKIAGGDSPRVAVCIPTYNQASYLGLAVRSAFAQSYQNVEVWVSDDSSTDGTAEVLESLRFEFPTLHVHRQPINRNIAENTSWLLSQPNADYLVRLDSDDVLEPHYVETLVSMLEAFPEAGYAHAAVAIIDEAGVQRSVARLRRATGFVSAERALRDSVFGYRVTANIVMFRSDVVRRLNFYRGRPDYVEDYDLSIRIADIGFGNVYSDAVLARYRTWSDAGLVRAKRKAMHLQGLTKVFEGTLVGAFQKREWDAKLLDRERLKLALRHSQACFAKHFTVEEHLELIALLYGLAGPNENRALAKRLRMLSIGLGPAYSAARRVRIGCISRLKSVVSFIRNFRKTFSRSRSKV